MATIEIADVLLPQRHPPQDAEATSAYALLLDICRELQAVEGRLEDVLALIVDKTVEMLGCEVAWLAMSDGEQAEMRIVASRGVQPIESRVRALPPGGADACADQLQDFPDGVRSAIRAQGLSSLLTAPIWHDGAASGTLIAGSRCRATFSSAHVAVLATLAEHGAIAIQNAQLFHELATHNGVLEKSFEVHRRVTATGLRGTGTAGVIQMLGRMLRRTIHVELDPDFAVPGPSPDGASRVAPGDLAPAGRAPMVVGDERLGEIVAYGDVMSELELHTLEHGATVLAAELLRRRSALEAEWRLQGELLEEVVDAASPLPESLRLRAQRAGVDLSLPRHIAVIDVVRGDARDQHMLTSLRGVVRRHGTGDRVLTFRRGTRIVMAIATVAVARIEELSSALEDSLASSGAIARVGISRAACDLDSAYREAGACARLAASSTAGTSIVWAAGLAPFSALFDAADLSNAEVMVREFLGPLAQHDKDGRVPLLDTVAAYVGAGGHAASAAAACFVHVTTLKYRLDLAAEHLHGPLTAPDVRFELRSAVSVLAILEALGLDPLERRQASGTQRIPAPPTVRAGAA